MGAFAQWMLRIHESAVRTNNRNILRLLEPWPNCCLIDLGCNDGAWTKRVASALHTSRVSGIDLSQNAGRVARTNGIEYIFADLSKPLPICDNSMDVVHANQVIEHLADVDTFVQETYRILRPGGYAIISTENLASVDNLFAMAMGQQAFSQHVSRRFHIGNRFSPHYAEPVPDELGLHRTVFAFYALRQLLQLYDFDVEAELGAGYPPFPSILGLVDPIHARFITAKARKPQVRLHPDRKAKPLGLTPQQA